MEFHNEYLWDSHWLEKVREEMKNVFFIVRKFFQKENMNFEIFIVKFH